MKKIAVILSLLAVVGCATTTPKCEPCKGGSCAAAVAPCSKVDSARIGVCSWSWRENLRGVAGNMEKTGVKGIHLALGPFIHPDNRHGEAESSETWEFVKKQAAEKKWNIFSTMVGMVGEDYSTLESIRKTGGIVPDETWEENKKIIREGARLTKELGCRYMSLHAGFLDETDKQALAKYVSRVKWMRDEAAKYDVEIILESGQETAEDLAKFMKMVPGIGINFDPANMILYGKGNPSQALDILLPWIRQIHVKDAKYAAIAGTWGEEVAWSEGEVGGEGFVLKLESLGYRGNYVIEREAGDNRFGDISKAVRALAKP